MLLNVCTSCYQLSRSREMTKPHSTKILNISSTWISQDQYYLYLEFDNKFKTPHSIPRNELVTFCYSQRFPNWQKDHRYYKKYLKQKYDQRNALARLCIFDNRIFGTEDISNTKSDKVSLVTQQIPWKFHSSWTIEIKIFRSKMTQLLVWPKLSPYLIRDA